MVGELVPDDEVELTRVAALIDEIESRMTKWREKSFVANAFSSPPPCSRYTSGVRGSPSFAEAARMRV